MNTDSDMNNQVSDSEEIQSEQDSIASEANAPVPDEPVKGKKKKPAKTNKKRHLIITIINALIIVALSVALSLFLISFFNDAFAVVASDKEIIITIEDKAHTEDVAALLEENGIVDNKYMLLVYIKLFSKDYVLMPGTKSFNTNMTYNEIIDVLGKVTERKEEVTVTVTEGENLIQIAEKLEKNKVCDAKAFLEYLNLQTYDYEFLSGSFKNNLKVYFRYEGYFYPDTYNFFVDEDYALNTESKEAIYDEIAKKFLNRFQKAYDELKATVTPQLEKLNMDFPQLITLASIIQKECGNINEMGAVSSVFHNRLDNSDVYPKLQSDVTSQYVSKYISDEKYNKYSGSDLKTLTDAYDTYVCEGLIPGAICNPTKEAMRAAAFPEKTEYFYFVTDNAGKYYYAITLSGHEKNVAEANRVNKLLKDSSKEQA